MQNKRSIILIGFFGTGKSTIGRRLAQELNWEFVDTDRAIEELTGLSVAEIFRVHGETRFHSEEALLVKRLSEKRDCVIATGGGTVLNPDNWELLARRGWMISLYAPVETILERVKARKSSRPLLKGGKENIEELWLARQKVFAGADLTIDTTGKDVEQIAGEILTCLNPNMSLSLKEGEI